MSADCTGCPGFHILLVLGCTWGIQVRDSVPLVLLEYRYAQYCDHEAERNWYVHAQRDTLQQTSSQGTRECKASMSCIPSAGMPLACLLSRYAHGNTRASHQCQDVA